MATRKTKPKPAPQHLISTRLRAGQCRQCGAVTLSGYVKGTMTRIDPMALSLRGEALALVAGIRTFDVSALRRDGTACRRTTSMIREGLPRYGRVHAEHRCGMDWHEHRDTRQLFAHDGPQSDEPPF